MTRADPRPAVAATSPDGSDIGRVAVVGAGTMGAGIALALLNAGRHVTLSDRSPHMLERAQAGIAKLIARDVEKGRIDAAEASARKDRLSLSAGLEGAADADLVIEAVFEDMAVKREVFAALDAVVRPDAILASNTSTLDLDAIAAATAHPARVVGLHFFSPAHVMKLVEVVRGADTAPQVVEAARRFVADIGKVGVVSGVCDGFIGNRIFEEELRQAYLLVEEGAAPEDVDAALEAFGMAMGPFKVMDLAGQDIGWSIRKRRAESQPERPYSRFPDKVCQLGRFGQKTGRGVYLYPDGRTPEVDPEIEALAVAHSKEIGVERRAVGPEEIVERCLLAMVNEGAHILAEGIAERPADIDTVFVQGYGFPRDRGGPMTYADSLGLPHVVTRLRALAQGREGWPFAPADLLVRLADSGQSLASLNG
jgi:3-hydroxyacyl-CoA dehydrogenase